MKNPPFRLASVLSLALAGSLAISAGSAFAETMKLPPHELPANAASKDSLNLQRPSWVYDNWGIYDPIRNMPLTEELVLREIDEIARLKKEGVRFDYYMMNAFWFEKDSGYRDWDKRYWPNGPDRWIKACQENGLTPGMWFACNLIWRTGVAPAWRDSYGGDDYRPYGPDMNGALSMFEGGFLTDFIAAMQKWYDRGIRVFEFDMADLNAATPASRATLSNREIREKNKAAFISALAAFRQKNPEALMVGFNGFKALDKRSMDLDWLKVYETLFGGDTRVSELPLADYYRSMDLFNDQRVFAYFKDGVPLHRIDPCGSVLSHNVFGIYRKTTAWKSMILLSVSRGAWKQTVYGALEEIQSGADAAWFARVQQLFNPLLTTRSTRIFGGMPEEGHPYGYVTSSGDGAIYTVVNPSQTVSTIPLALAQDQRGEGRVLFRDAGFVPVVKKGSLTLGPGQMAVVGYGRYAGPKYDLGIEQDVVIPQSIATRTEVFRQTGPKTLEATFIPPTKGDLRIVFTQSGPNGEIVRVQQYPLPRDPKAEGPIPGTGMRIEAWQPGFSLTVHGDQRTSAPGIAWGVGEVRQKDLVAGRPITIRCTTADKRDVVLKAELYTVEY